MEERIRALAAEGLSVRAIANQLGVNRGKVHRVLMAHRAADAAGAVPKVAAVADDPILGLLTSDDLAHLGLTPAEVAGGLNVLQRYRFLGLPAGSAAGDAACSLFDHGRGEEAFDQWVHAGTGRAPEDLLAWIDEE